MFTDQELFVLQEMARDYRTSWFSSRMSFHKSRRDIRIPLECSAFSDLMRSIRAKAPGLLYTYYSRQPNGADGLWRIDREFLLKFFIEGLSRCA